MEMAMLIESLIALLSALAGHGGLEHSQVLGPSYT